MGRVRKTLRHTFIYACGLMLSRGVAFALIPMYTRVPSFEQGGIGIARWELCMTTAFFLTPLLDLGLASGLLRFYHRYETEEERRRTFNTSFTFLAIVQLPILGLAFAGSEYLSQLIFQTPDLAHLVKLTALVASMTVLGNQPLSWFRAQEQSMIFAGLNIVRAIIGPTTIIVLVCGFKLGPEAVLIGELAGLTAMAAAGLTLCRRWIRPRMERATLGAMLRFGAPLMVAGFGTAVLISSDRYFLKRWGGENDLAIYAIGAKVGIIVQFIARALQTAYPPAAIKLAKEPDGPKMIAQMLRLLLLALAGTAIALCALTPEVLRVLAPHKDYGPGMFIAPFVAMGFALHAGAFNVMTAFSITHKTKYVPVVVCSGGIVKLLLCWALIGKYGMMGAAWATLIGFVLEFALAYILTQRVYPVPHDWGRFTGLGLLSGATLGVIFLGMTLPTLPSLLLRLGALAVFALISFGCLLKAEERQSVWAFVTRKRRGQSSS